MKQEFLNCIHGWIDAGYPGGELAKRCSDHIDRLVRRIFQESGAGEGLVLLAVGGYGRRELAPFSDIDLMFFAPDRACSKGVERVLYPLWDTGLDISHSFRTPSECIEEAFKDTTTRTTLLEARYLAGDRTVYDLYQREIYPEVAFRRQKSFVREKLKELERRRASTGDSVCLLEPHIKEGEGGLRDIHAVYWLAKVAFRLQNFDGIAAHISSYDWKRLTQARDFLLRTRFCLHLETGRRNDILTFEYQRGVAGRLGFRDSKKFSASERMLRYYYLKARIVREVTAGIISDCSRQYAPVFRDFGIRKLRDGFLVAGGRLIERNLHSIAKDPERILESYSLFAETGRPFGDVMRAEIRGALMRINRRIRSSPRAVRFFLNIFSTDRIFETLKDMHETGVLGRFIPEFGALRSLVVREPHHLYTVDEHTLMAVRRLEELRKPTFGQDDLLSEVMRSFGQPDVLFLALLLHDIGKAAGRHHEEEGYRRLKGILERFGMEPEKRRRIEFLVKNHIRMARTALTRDADDPSVVASFSGTIGDRENLDGLYLLTYADMSAVNPLFWTSWKAHLLRDLYLKTRDRLSGFSAGRKNLKACVSAQLDDLPEEDVELFFQEMPERYFLSASEDTVRHDCRVFLEARGSGFSGRVRERQEGITDITFCAPDQEGLFARAVGFLSARGLNIVHGRIHTCRSGLALDTFAVSNWREIWWDGLEASVLGGLADVLAGRRTVSPVRQEERTPGLFAESVELDNESSEDFTIIEVFANDRMGLLSSLASSIHRAGVDVVAARITTESGIAEDVFYVQSGRKKVDNTTAIELISVLWNELRS